MEKVLDIEPITKSPCLNCQERHRLCWSECKRYKIYNAYCEKQRAKRKENQLVDRYSFDRIAKAAKIKEWKNK